MSQRTAPILANRYWNDTGVQVQEGRGYRVRVVPGLGEPLRDARFEAAGIDGEDWQSLPHKAAELVNGKRVDEARWFALIGTVDRGRPFLLTERAPFTAPATGQLVCYFNDVELEIFYKNNSGSVVLDVEDIQGP